jgi:hypothetical protein
MTQGLFPQEERTTFGVMAMQVFIAHSALLALVATVCVLFESYSYPKINQLAVGCVIVLLFPFVIVLRAFGDRVADQAVPWLLFAIGLWLFTVIFWTCVVTGVVWLCRRLRAKLVINETHVSSEGMQIRSGYRDTLRWLFPYARPWTPAQKWIIACAVSLGVYALGCFYRWL